MPGAADSHAWESARDALSPPPGRQVKPRHADNGRKVYLLSLFDGIGKAMHALAQWLISLGRLTHFGGAWFCEKDRDLANKVQTHWHHQESIAGTPPYTGKAADVWDLIRNDCLCLREVLWLIPIGALFLLIGGSPCLHHTTGGRFKGQVGKCGTDSLLFYIFPVVIFFVQLYRPDIVLHTIVENAGSLLELFRNAICDSLGIPPALALRVEPTWTALERCRF